jgi:hypothetical protein
MKKEGIFIGIALLVVVGLYFLTKPTSITKPFINPMTGDGPEPYILAPDGTKIYVYN